MHLVLQGCLLRFLELDGMRVIVFGTSGHGGVAKPKKLRGRLRMYRRRPRRRLDGIRSQGFGCNECVAQHPCLRTFMRGYYGMKRFSSTARTPSVHPFRDGEDAVGTSRRQFCNTPQNRRFQRSRKHRNLRVHLTPWAGWRQRLRPTVPCRHSPTAPCPRQPFRPPQDHCPAG